MATHLRTELVVDALHMALWRRKPAAGLIHHSDQGVQYTSLSFDKRLEEAGIVPSMGRVGSAYDNALAESFIATLKSELLYRHSWPTRESVRTAIFEYLEDFTTATGSTQLWVTGALPTSRRVKCERSRQRKENVSVLTG